MCTSLCYQEQNSCCHWSGYQNVLCFFFWFLHSFTFRCTFWSVASSKYFKTGLMIGVSSNPDASELLIFTTSIFCFILTYSTVNSMPPYSGIIFGIQLSFCCSSFVCLFSYLPPACQNICQLLGKQQTGLCALRTPLGPCSLRGSWQQRRWWRIYLVAYQS